MRGRVDRRPEAKHATRSPRLCSPTRDLIDDQDYGQFVSFNLGDGSSALALYPWEAVAADAGVGPEGSGFRGITLSTLVPSSKEVDDVLAQAERAGGTIVKLGCKARWGCSGHFSDPDGYLWKVAAANS